MSLGLLAGYLLEDRVEGLAHGFQVAGHGGTRVVGGSGLDGGQDVLVFNVRGVLAVSHHVQGFRLVGQGVADIGHDAFEDLVAAGAGDGGMESGVQGHPGFGVGFGGHGGHDLAEGVQLVVGAALGGQAGGGDFDVRAGLGQVAGGVLPQRQVVGYLVGHHERALAGLGDRQAQGGAGAEGLPDDGAAHAVLLGEGGLGAEFAAHGNKAGFDVHADRVEYRFGGAEPREGDHRLSCCPAV